jgi:hypothetical protein
MSMVNYTLLDAGICHTLCFAIFILLFGANFLVDSTIGFRASGREIGIRGSVTFFNEISQIWEG